jgi:prepilin-type N-terminal cleavage/methylation domain-containing protein
MMKKAAFTLIEMMVAITVSSLLIGAILGLLISQGRAVDGMRDGADQLEQLRAVTDFVAAEIEDLPRGAMVAAESDSIAFRLPIAWGSVCGDLSRLVKTKAKTKETNLTPPDISSGIFLEPLPSALGAPTPQGFGAAADGVNWTWFDVSVWSNLSLAPSQAARQACLGLDSTHVITGDSLEADRFQEFEDLEVYLGLLPPEGMVIAPYMYVSYYFRTGTDGVVLYRATAAGVQKLAWPFDADAGFRFRLEDDTEGTSVSGGSLADIRWIKLNLPALKTDARSGTSNSLTAAPWIPLYNSR